MTQQSTRERSSTRIPVLEIGGTHTTAAWATASGEVDLAGRVDLDNSGTAAELVATVAEAAATLSAGPGLSWGVAIPGPFDYDAGIGDYASVEKFQAWSGFDLGAALREALDARAVWFINDADAFGVGENMAGRTRGCHRSLGLTIGTGIGSAFIVDGVPVVTGPGVPPLGEVHLLSHEGVPLEERVSRGAIREAWQQVSGDLLEVKDVAELARQGNEQARQVFDDAYLVLSEVIGPVVELFGAEHVVMGGSIARSQDLVLQYFASRLVNEQGRPVPVSFSEDPERSAIVGAAHWAQVRDSGGSYA